MVQGPSAHSGENYVDRKSRLPFSMNVVDILDGMVRNEKLTLFPGLLHAGLVILMVVLCGGGVRGV